MARKKRPSLENYLVTGKVHWEPEEAKTPPPSEKDLPGEIEKLGKAQEKNTPPRKSQEVLEKETLFLSMLREEDREIWKPLFAAKESCFDVLQVKERRQFFEEQGIEGKVFKLRRRRQPLESVEEAKDISFPLLALFQETEDSICVWCNHLT